ncbi:MAG: saccharopine dehydrogenase C-terminal domain-containing protein [Candidatus Neomarinimicrobiota bacterium]
MKVLLLGVGMQGKAVLHDLVQSDNVEEIVAADLEIGNLKQHVNKKQYGTKVRCEYLDVTDQDNLDRLMRQGPHVAIELLHQRFQASIARSAVKHGIHLVNAFYIMPGLSELNEEAKSRGVSILPEFGLDPGIDLVLLGEAVRSFDKLEEINIYGAGIPEPEASEGPLRYKVSWTLKGVLDSYVRPARIIRNRNTIHIGRNELFHPENIHEIEIGGIGRLEAFPNDDVLDYVSPLGFDLQSLQNLGRYTLRWPGHANFWREMVDLHLLDDEPLVVGNTEIDPRRFLAAAMGPHMQYGDSERDLVIVRVDITGSRGGRRKRAIYQVTDRRDLGSGFTAMSRTVGFTTSIGAQMIGTGRISKRGILSPATDVPYDIFCRELKDRGIRITSEFRDLRSGLAVGKEEVQEKPGSL